MKMPGALIITISVLIFALQGCERVDDSQTEERPSIFVIMTDDQAYRTVNADEGAIIHSKTQTF